jgi:uncharacterized protein YcfJ
MKSFSFLCVGGGRGLPTLAGKLGGGGGGYKISTTLFQYNFVTTVRTLVTLIQNKSSVCEIKLKKIGHTDFSPLFRIALTRQRCASKFVSEDKF